MSQNLDLDRIAAENINIIAYTLKSGKAGSFPVNMNIDGTAYTITTRCGNVGFSNLLCGGGHYPSTAVLEITEDE